MKLAKPVALLVSLCLIVSLSLMGEAKGKIRISVKNSKGAPIPNVKITLTSTEIPSIRYVIFTNERGIATHGALENHFFEFTFEKEGYQGSKKTIKIPAKELKTEEITLFTLEEAINYKDAADPHTRAINKYNQAALFLKKNEDKEALPLLRESISLDDTIYQSHYEIAKILYLQEDYQGAIDHLNRVISLNKEYSSAYRLLAGAYEKMGNKAESEKYAKMAQEIGGATGIDKYNEALGYFNSKDIDTAIPLFEEALKLDKNFAPSYYYLGLAYINKGENEKAISRLEKYLELDPQGLNSETARSLLKFLKK